MDSPKLFKIRTLSEDLNRILTELDNLGQAIAAAHVQAGLDVLRYSVEESDLRPTPKNTIK